MLTKLFRPFVFVLLGLLASEGLVRNIWRIGFIDFDLEMWRYARELKIISDDPAIGLEHQPNKEALLMGVSVSTDEMGFRRHGSSAAAKPTVMVVGDSETLGWGVPESETYSAQLERAHPGLRFLNAGIGNTNTSMQVNLLKANLKKITPRWIILGYSLNDPETNPKLEKSFQMTDLALGFLIKKFYRLAMQSSSMNYVDYNHSLYLESSENWAKWKVAAAELAEVSRKESIPVSVLLIPELHEPKNFGQFRDVYDKVSRELSALGFEVIDPSSDFPDGDGSPFWVDPLDPHPNSRAHKIFADALMKSKYFQNER